MAHNKDYANTISTPVRTEKLRYGLILCFVASLPFHIIYSQVILYLLVATTLMSFRVSMLRAIPKQFWLFAGVYLLGALGYIYSTDKHAAGYLMERQLSILIMPLAIPMAFYRDESRIRTILLVFTLSCTGAVLFLFGQALYTIHLNHFPARVLFTNTFFHHGFSGPLGIHATYLSLYVALCLFYCVYRFAKTTSMQERIWLGLCLLVLAAGLFFLATRSVWIATALILFFIFPLYVIRKKWLYYIILLVAAGISGILVFKVDYFRERFGKQLVQEIYAPHTMAMSDASPEPRIERWEGAVELIRLSPWIGYGTGDEVKFMKIKYIEHRQFVSYLYSFNAHNEYISIVLKHGFVGLFIFLGLFGYYLRIAIRQQDFIYMAFIGLLLIVFITENVLDSNKGIFFFAFFNTLFGYFHLEKTRDKPADTVK
ncbi:MAG: O-antigen ligase family protein [Bacteroidetes bacterium]|nr:O-antigen ligase family protein [Bacteroidota bacterium]